MTHSSPPRRPLSALAWGLASFLPGASLAVTISEIHYDPPGESSGLEFVELHNDAPTVVDVSGWAFTEGIDITFPKGTWIPGRGHLVIVSNDAVFRAAYPGVAIGGVFAGRLDSNGETLVLSNNGGGEVVRMRYDDRGKWPSLPTGTGHTLCLRRPHLDPAEPESWAPSLLPGGTPGQANFPTGSVSDFEIIPGGATWSYKKGTVEFSSPPDAWRKPGFSTAGWASGASGFGYGDGDDATVLDDMANGYMSVAIRKTFSMTRTAIDGMETLILGSSYDDGFVAYLNGTEVVRASMPGAPGSAVPFDTAGVSHEAGAEEQFEVSKSLLVAGENVLAVQGHNAATSSSDFSLAVRLLGRKVASAGGSASSIVFNELLGRTAGARWVELYNTAPAPVDLSGHFLSDSAAALDRHALLAGTVVDPYGFLVVTEGESGLNLAAAEVRLYLTLPDGSASIAAEIFENAPADGLPASREGYSDARVPDGTGRFGYSRTPTPGAPNVVDAPRDIVLNEIFYNPPDSSRTTEFIELYNRGSSNLDLTGWAFTKGVSFTFPAVSLPAGGLLVVSADPAGLESAHGITGVLGPWTGSLSNSGENVRLVDPVGNVAGEVRYSDGGRWSPWADGGGSSLELIDPRQDGSFATAWAASDEGAKAEWRQVTYTASYAPEAASELHMLLLDAGTVRIDDVSLKRQGAATEYIGNGTFESNTSPWLLQGNHIATHRTTADAHTGSACLELVATGGGDSGVNKIDTDTSPGMTAGTYTVSFWARWLRGGDKLLVRADTPGNGSLARVVQLTLPVALGTPGRENSARLALKAQFPDGNLGPVIGDVAQRPVVPSAASPVTVRARAHDSDGVASMAIQYRTGGLGNGVFTAAPMFDDGAHGDEKAGDGLFAGAIPAQAQGTRVVFYLEGADAAGRTRRFPVVAPSETLLYAVETAASSALFTVRLYIDDDNESTLRGRLLHSDDLVDASFVFNDEEIYYNVGTRYRGSPWNRPPDPKMYRVRFNEDRAFIRGPRPST
ncbi:MAG: lamin tail domain-containing protein [Planctomycetes bacterium]|nr:lamin tail domain-containing protein [Planctomycetota bacterium]